jgi:hypothetical protein
MNAGGYTGSRLNYIPFRFPPLCSSLGKKLDSMRGSHKDCILSEIQVWPPGRKSEFIAPLNILRFNEFRFSLLLSPYERDAVCKGAANHTQKQNSGGYLFHTMYYNTEGKIHKFTSPVIRRLVN